MSTKIQILNEKQVDHFVDTLLPKLVIKFNTVRDVLREKAEKEKDNFVTHAEVIKLKAEHSEKLETSKKLLSVNKLLKEIGKDYYISQSGYYNCKILENDEGIEKLIKDQAKELDELLLRLSKENLFVDEAWTRREYMTEELRARLNMTAVDEFNNIEKVIIEAIDIYSFFKTKITNN